MINKNTPPPVSSPTHSIQGESPPSSSSPTHSTQVTISEVSPPLSSSTHSGTASASGSSPPLSSPTKSGTASGSASGSRFRALRTGIAVVLEGLAIELTDEGTAATQFQKDIRVVHRAFTIPDGPFQHFLLQDGFLFKGNRWCIPQGSLREALIFEAKVLGNPNMEIPENVLYSNSATKSLGIVRALDCCTILWDDAVYSLASAFLATVNWIPNLDQCIWCIILSPSVGVNLIYLLQETVGGLRNLLEKENSSTSDYLKFVLEQVGAFLEGFSVSAEVYEPFYDRLLSAWGDWKSRQHHILACSELIDILLHYMLCLIGEICAKNEKEKQKDKTANSKEIAKNKGLLERIEQDLLWACSMWNEKHQNIKRRYEREGNQSD